jgi:hypothetical protein
LFSGEPNNANNFMNTLVENSLSVKQDSTTICMNDEPGSSNTVTFPSICEASNIKRF